MADPNPKPGGSSSLLAQARNRSRRRKELLKHMLGVEDLKSALGTSNESASNVEGNRGASTGPESNVTASYASAGHSDFQSSLSPSSSSVVQASCSSPPPEKKSKTPRSVTPEELTEAEKKDREFRDSKAFLKGTQSMNPHNDYSQNFVDTEQRPQNFIRDVGLADRFEEYPKLRELIRLKNEQV